MSEIKDIINHWDPIQIKNFTPDDEYELEINEIYEFTKTSQEPFILANEIHRIFTDSFGADLFQKTLADCQDIAAKIINLSSGKNQSTIPEQSGDGSLIDKNSD